MKKLVCAVAAVAAGVAFADTGIASANIVGYLNKDGWRGNGSYDQACSSFQKADGTQATLADFSVTDYPEEDCGAAIKICEINAGGGVDSIMVGGKKLLKNYSWYDYGKDMPAGWYDDKDMMIADEATCEAAGYEQSAFGDAADITFVDGKGFRVIQADGYPNAKLVFAGGVKKTDTHIEDFRGSGSYDICGNNTPVNVTLADMYVEDYPDEDCGAAIKICEINAGGGVDSITVGGKKLLKNYSWYDYGKDMPAGWYDDKDMMIADEATCEAAGYEQSAFGDAADIVFAPGYAFRVIQADGYPDAKLVIPAPEGL